MAGENRGTSSLFRRAEQLRRWQESETNNQDCVDSKRNKRKVKFSDGCIFLAAGAAGDREELKRLIDRGADVNTVNQDGITALHAACIDNNLEIVEFLVSNGADINRCDMEGWTPLHATASCGSLSMAKFLIDQNADLSVVNNDGELAIDVVDEDDMANLLQEEMDIRGIDCDASRSREERRMLEDAQLWLTSCVYNDVPHAKTGATALHVSAAKGYIRVMRLLIEAGADINAKDFDGWTPLHAASHWGQTEAVEILCENLADMDMINCVGQTPYDLANASMQPLMDELKRKQASIKLAAPKANTKKRKTSPSRTERERSNKKERETQSVKDSFVDGVSSDDEARDASAKSPSSLQPETIVNPSEIQSWRRPSIKNKEDKENKEDLRNAANSISSPHVNNEEVIMRKESPTAKTDSGHLDRRKAYSCLVLSPVQESENVGDDFEQDRGQGMGEIGDVLSKATSHSLTSLSSEPGSFSCLEEPDFELPVRLPELPEKIGDNSCIQASICSEEDKSSSEPSTLLSIFGEKSDSAASISMNQSWSCSSDTSAYVPAIMKRSRSFTDPSSKVLKVEFNLSKTSDKSDRPTTMNLSPIATKETEDDISRLSTSICDDAPLLCSSPATSPQPKTKEPVIPSSITTSLAHLCDSKLSISSIAALNRPRSFSGISRPTRFPSLLPLSSSLDNVPRVSSTNEDAINISSKKRNEFLARSQSLNASLKRNCQDIPLQEPNYAGDAPESSPNKSSGLLHSSRTFVPPSRDEESETQRKAHAKMVRSTRRSTQGITLEDVKSAEQYMKKANAAVKSNGPSVDATPTIVISRAQGMSNDSTVDEKSKDPPETDATPTVTLSLRKKSNAEEKKDEKGDDKQSTREGTQAAIQRRKKPKRRSTGVVHVDMEEIDPDRKKEKSSEGEDENDPGTDRRDANSSSSAILSKLGVGQPRSVSRTPSIGRENGEKDYKKLYEEQLVENDKLQERLRGQDKELRMAKDTIDNNSKTSSARSMLAESERREKRALERKLSEMEEELRELDQLRQENQRLRDENGALIRVISKLSR